MRSVSMPIALVAVSIIALAGCGSGGSPSPASIPSATTDEEYLLSGIRPDAAIGCVPLRSALPAGATASLQCTPNDGAVDRFRVSLFSSTNEVLALYHAEMTARGVALNSGGCDQGNGESTYIPGPDHDRVPYRHGCFVTEVANYRAIVDSQTTAGTAHVYIAIVGKSTDAPALDAYAWKGNEDTPGSPTLWRTP